MKYIAVVLIVFGLVATGVGVYFIRQSQVASLQSQAYETVRPLRRLVPSDCDFIYLPECPDVARGTLNADVPVAVEKVISRFAPQSIQKYSEYVSPEVFTSLGNPSDLPVKNSYTVADSIARVSLSSGINYKVLIALIAAKPNYAWDGTTSVSNPLGRRELSFTEQLAGAAKSLKDEYQYQTQTPIALLTVANTTYGFEKDVKASSRALYLYFSKTESPAYFKTQVAISDSLHSFSSVWTQFFSQ